MSRHSRVLEWSEGDGWPSATLVGRDDVCMEVRCRTPWSWEAQRDLQPHAPLHLLVHLGRGDQRRTVRLVMVTMPKLMMCAEQTARRMRDDLWRRE